MKLVIFTVDEANRLLPHIRPRVERLVQAKRGLDRLKERIEVLGVAISGASPDNPDARELRALREQRDALAGQVSAEIAAIHRRGCHVKDLDRGLVDFYALAGDRLVYLCWRLGEPEVAHWHTLDGGYAARQPLHRTELD